MPVRAAFIFSASVLLSGLARPVAAGADRPVAAPPEARKDVPQIIKSDGMLRLSFGDERIVLPGGLQPSLLCTRSGTLILQAQIPRKPFASKRIVYFSAMCTEVSRDGGVSWTVIPLKPGQNGLNMEGGATQLHDGTIIALDTYVTPGNKPGAAEGQLYTSRDDWETLQGPRDVSFDIPGAKFNGSTDDGGRPQAAQRAHRRIIELPDGDLLTTIYGWLKGDNTPSTYAPTMMRTRVLLVRSSDRGRHWNLIATVASGPGAGTEGFGEPVLCRISKGSHPGRLICFMRTGRNLCQASSDDDGVTWTPPRPLIFAGLDVNRTDLWIDHFRRFKGTHRKPLDEHNLDELRGAVVDPELIELRSGLLVAAFGVRVPQKFCFRHPEFAWNGDYLAFSRDHGRTWGTVVRVTSGVLTTQYMAIEETPTGNTLYLTYDLGAWSKPTRGSIIGRLVKIEE